MIKDELTSTYKEEFSTDEILKKINNLRTQFCENYKKFQKQLPSGSGTSDDNKPSWWLYEHLMFLIPYIKKDKGVSNMCPAEPVTITTSQEVTADPEEMPNDAEGDYEIAEDGILSPACSINESSASTSTIGSRTRRAKRVRKESGSDPVASAMVNAIDSIIKQEMPSKTYMHSDLKLFIDYVAAKMDKISNKKI
ncbi:hypothetical protein RN001_003306 [Aquatica leii]|uniref:MADF domain-containing protein n=1 Tax=Aquatica leii TaxID=1421715 RepID=A0AAN7PET8_9COLE|nr:hypothetical protein RN001_003306 [Aquatica leii]